MSASSALSPRRRWWKRVAVVLAATLAGVLFLELGYRGWLALRGRSFDADATRLEIERLVSTARDSVPRVTPDLPWNPANERAQGRIVHPFWGFENVGGMELLSAETQRIGKPEYDADLEILVVGGSVAEIFVQFGREELDSLLRADPRLAQRPLHVYPFARGGFKQPQQLDLVNYFLGLGFTPEIVLNVDGFNEVALSSSNARKNVNPTYPSLPHWGMLAVGGIVDRESIDLAADGRANQRRIIELGETMNATGLWRSAIAGRYADKRMNVLRDEVARAFTAYELRMKGEFTDLVLRGPPFDSSPGAVVRDSVRMWSESSRSLRALCEARGIGYVHVLQPTLHDTPNRTMTKKELKIGAAPEEWIEGVHLGYPLLRAAGVELARGGERFVDATPLFKDIPETVYIDNCHFLDLGNRHLAAVVAKSILEALPAR